MRESGGDAVAIERGIDGGGHGWDVHIAGEEGGEVAGGFLGLLDRLNTNDLAALRQATVMGSTIASFTVEQFSLDRLRDLDLGQVRRRFDAFRALVHFEELPAHFG